MNSEKKSLFVPSPKLKDQHPGRLEDPRGKKLQKKD